MSSVRSTLKSSVTSSQQREPSSRPTSRLSGGLTWLQASWLRNGVEVWTHESAVTQEDWASMCAWAPTGKKTNTNGYNTTTLSRIFEDAHNILQFLSTKTCLDFECQAMKLLVKTTTTNKVDQMSEKHPTEHTTKASYWRLLPRHASLTFKKKKKG